MQVPSHQVGMMSMKIVAMIMMVVMVMMAVTVGVLLVMVVTDNSDDDCNVSSTAHPDSELPILS